jgi:hypothetical protein
VKGRPFTLFPASVKGLKRLVEGGSSMCKPPEEDDNPVIVIAKLKKADFSAFK